MAKQKVKKKSFTPSSQSPRQPPPKDKVVLGPSSPSSRQPPMPSSVPPSLALDSQPTVKTNPSSISNLGKAPVALLGAHVSAGPSTRKHKSISATKFVEDIPPENLASEEDMEEEESSSCDFGSCSNDSSEPRLSQPPPFAANGAPSPSSPSAPIGDSGPAERLSAPIYQWAELEFASFPSDPMCAEVVAAVGDWEIVKEKKQRSRNVKQAVAMDEESVAVGFAFPHVSGEVSR